MSIERRKELNAMGCVNTLTDAEILAGIHYCPQWDFLVVGPEDPEWGEQESRCLCGLDLNSLVPKEKTT